MLNFTDARQSVLNAELQLSYLQKHAGRTSDQYRQALSQFAAAWTMLQSSREPQAFFP
jgi:hypothetical protein